MVTLSLKLFRNALPFEIALKALPFEIALTI